MAVHYAGGDGRPVCNNAPFRTPPLPTSNDPDEVTCGTCQALLNDRHLRVLRPNAKPQVDVDDPDTVRSTEVPYHPGYYHDDTGREFTTRGLQVYGRIVDTHGVEARVQESSQDNQMWLFTDQSEDLCFNVEQAKLLRDALDLFISIKSA